MEASRELLDSLEVPRHSLVYILLHIFCTQEAMQPMEASRELLGGSQTQPSIHTVTYILYTGGYVTNGSLPGVTWQLGGSQTQPSIHIVTYILYKGGYATNGSLPAVTWQLGGSQTQPSIHTVTHILYTGGYATNGSLPGVTRRFLDTA